MLFQSFSENSLLFNCIKSKTAILISLSLFLISFSSLAAVLICSSRQTSSAPSATSRRRSMRRRLRPILTAVAWIFDIFSNFYKGDSNKTRTRKWKCNFCLKWSWKWQIPNLISPLQLPHSALFTVVVLRAANTKSLLKSEKPTAADSLLCQTMHKLSFHPMDNIYPHCLRHWAILHWTTFHLKTYLSEIWKVDREKYECYFHHQGYCGKMVRPENRNLISIVLARSPTLKSKKPAVIVMGPSNYHHCNFRFCLSTTEPVLILG